MDAEAVLKHRVRNEQTSGEKKSPSKGVLIYYFFPAHMQIFRPIGHTFGSRRCAADFSLLNLPKGKSLGHSKPATSSYAQAPQHTVWDDFYYIQALLNCLL
jgi:hypothetical protein